MKRIGVGTVVKMALHHIGVPPSDSCDCALLALIMDEEGPAWCCRHVEPILDKMQEEAGRRNLSFWRPAALLALLALIAAVAATNLFL